MTDQERKAMEMALGALIASHPIANTDKNLDKHSEAMSALRQALAQDKQEPVAEVHTFLVGSPYAIVRVTGEMDLEDELFLAAPPSKPWVSLTDEEIFEIWEIGGTELESVRAIEAALKEKNT